MLQEFAICTSDLPTCVGPAAHGRRHLRQAARVPGITAVHAANGSRSGSVLVCRGDLEERAIKREESGRMNATALTFSFAVFLIGRARHLCLSEKRP